MDTIEISNLRVRAVIGFSAHELQEPQDIVINLRIGTERRLAGETDDPADALNYRTICKAIIALVEGSRFALVEKLAEEIALRITVDFAAPWVEVSVKKPGALRHSDSAGIRIERRPADYAKNLAYISLGSNISPAKNIIAAIALLRRYTTLLAISPIYRTAPQGYQQQSPFLNMAAKAHTLRTLEDFKIAVIDRIERELKRERDPANKNGPRTIDLDISLWNDSIMQFGERPWEIPDPDIFRFAHVAVPLAALAPDYLHPVTGTTLSQIAGSFEADDLELVQLGFGSPGD